MYIQKFANEQRGSVAVLSGVTLMLVAMAAAGAVDVTNATKERHRLQDLADASSIAAARLPGATPAERRKAAIATFESSEQCKRTQCNDIKVKTDKDGMVTVTATADVPTSFLKIATINTIAVDVEASAIAAPPKDLEVAMMLDYSGSMRANGKYTAMGSAATSFVDQVESNTDGLGKIALVPFSKYVLAPMEGRYVYDVANATSLGDEKIFGCVLNRQHPYSINADTPNTVTEGSLWPVLSYVKSEEATSGGYSDDYTGQQQAPNGSASYSISGLNGSVSFDLDIYDDPSDGITPMSGLGSGAAHPDTGAPTYTIDGNNTRSYQLKTAALTSEEIAYIEQHVSFVNFLPAAGPTGVPLNNYAGSDGWNLPPDAALPPEFQTALSTETLPPFCQRYVENELWLRPLSTDYNGLRDAFQGMQPSGLTNIALALDLGWHSLTPNAPFEEPSDDEKVERIAVLLTDGVQTVQAHGPGDKYNIDSANSNIASSCKAMKDARISIYTIAFDIKSDATREMLRECSSGNGYFHEPSDGGELEGVFDSIFDKISSSGVRIVN